MALSIRLKADDCSPQAILFTDQDVRAFLAGLSVVYEEVFIWTNRNQVAIWVSGLDPIMICRAFQRHNVEILEMHKGQDAITFFHNIVEGKLWSETTSIDKLFQLDHARGLANEVQALRSSLKMIVASGINSLTNTPVVLGFQNGWSNTSSTAFKKKSKIAIDFSSALYRLSMN